MDRNERGELTLREAVERLMEALTERTACAVTVFTNKDAGYDMMPDDCVVISVAEGESELFIELDSQIVVSYKWWHRHYSFETEDRDGGFYAMLDDLFRLLRCETYQFVIFEGERWLRISTRSRRLGAREQIMEAAARELAELDREGSYTRAQREIFHEVADIALEGGVEWDVIRRLDGCYSEMTAGAAAVAGIDIAEAALKHTSPRPVLPELDDGVCVRCVFWDGSLDSETYFDINELWECLSRIDIPGSRKFSDM